MTPRAVRILSEVDLIAAEDTRHSRALLTHFGISKPLFSCHKFNEAKRAEQFLQALRDGKSIALISDAGTPCISDPGHILVRLAADEGFNVTPVCGVNAVIAALSVSGFDADTFSYIGFLPRSKKDILKKLEPYLASDAPFVFYESPLRIVQTLTCIDDASPQALVCLCNDLTKRFEKIYRGTVQDVLDDLANNPNHEKGEYTCVVQTKPLAEAKDIMPAISPEAQLVDLIIKNDCDLKTAATLLKEQNKNLRKNEIYQAMLNVKDLFDAD